MTPEDFIRKITHDLRSSLIALKDLPEWLVSEVTETSGPPSKKSLEILRMMRTYTSRLDQMLVDLSVYARLKRQENSPVAHMRDVGASADSTDAYVEQFGIETIPMEHEHAVLVTKHLLENAYKHAGGCSQTVTLTTVETEDAITLGVRDFGPGISEKHRKLVYEPLTTLQPRDVCEGSGMGLAIVAKVAELYGGHCGLQDTDDGTGILSTITVPRQAKPLPAPETLEPREVSADEVNGF